MSGGSWDSVCQRIDGVADRLIKEKSSKRRAFGKRLKKCARALYEGDMNAIGEVLDIISEDLEEIRRGLKEIRRCNDELEARINDR